MSTWQICQSFIRKSELQFCLLTCWFKYSGLNKCFVYSQRNGCTFICALCRCGPCGIAWCSRLLTGRDVIQAKCPQACLLRLTFELMRWFSDWSTSTIQQSLVMFSMFLSVSIPCWAPTVWRWNYQLTNQSCHLNLKLKMIVIKQSRKTLKEFGYYIRLLKVQVMWGKEFFEYNCYF